MGQNQCKKLGIKEGTVLGTVQLDVLWAIYDKKYDKKHHGNIYLERDAALKFLNDFSLAIGMDWDENLADRVIQMCSEQEGSYKGLLSKAEFSSLILSKRDQGVFQKIDFSKSFIDLAELGKHQNSGVPAVPNSRSPRINPRDNNPPSSSTRSSSPVRPIVPPQINARPVTPKSPGRPITPKSPGRPVTPKSPGRPVTPKNQSPSPCPGTPRTIAWA